jgi:hypothetical protein
MKIKLTTDDRNAIDLLLDQAVAAASAPSSVPSHRYAAGTGTEPVQAVRRVLQLLNALPAAKPPADLASKTLAHIARATGDAAGANAVSSHLLASQLNLQLGPDGQPHRPI